MLVTFRVLTALLALSTAAAPAAQGQVWHVDDSGGADFTTIQAAVDAAADGDTIVVAHGAFYSFFEVDGKGLVITAAAGEKPYCAGDDLVVRNLSASQSVVIRGFTTNYGLALFDNQGTVWVEDLELGTPLAPSLVQVALHGIEAANCASVVVSRTSAHGTQTDAGGNGNSGLRATGSTVHAFASVFSGANLSGSFPLVDGMPAAGTGASLEGSFLYAHGCRIAGGQGAAGEGCMPGGPGGTGLVAGAGAQVWLLDTELLGGPGGVASAPGCPQGSTGTASIEAGGSIDVLPGLGRVYALASPATGGGTTLLSYEGQPGDLVFSLVSLAPAPEFLPPLGGTLVLPFPALLVAHGPADPVTGAIPGLAVPLPSPPPGAEAITVYAQGACLTAAGDALLCTPSALTVL